MSLGISLTGKMVTVDFPLRSTASLTWVVGWVSSTKSDLPPVQWALSSHRQLVVGYPQHWSTIITPLSIYCHAGQCCSS